MRAVADHGRPKLASLNADGGGVGQTQASWADERSHERRVLDDDNSQCAAFKRIGERARGKTDWGKGMMCGAYL